MKSTYNYFKSNLGKQPLKDERGVTISDVIKDEVTYRTLEWKQWNLLFNRAQDGIIVPSSDKKNALGKSRPSANLPTKSDDLYDVFEKTVKELRTVADECVQKAVNHLLINLSNQLSSEIEHFNRILSEEKKSEIEETFSEEQFYTFDTVYDAYNPEKWLELELMKSVFQEKKYIETVNIFPLARQDEKHEIGQIFDWSSEYRTNNNAQSHNHILLVQRLRDEITASISLQIIEYVSQINKKVDKKISDIINDLAPELDTLLREEELLRYIAGEKQQINQADYISPILSQIASISTVDIAS